MWLNDLRLILEDRVVEHGALCIEGEHITAVSETAHGGDGPSLAGLTALPGLIDLHGDMLERDIEPRPGAMFPVEMAIHELDKRLAGTGITTAYAAVSFAWSKNELRTQKKATEIIREIARLRETLHTDLRVHARFEIANENTAPILEELLGLHMVDMVSLMDHTPGQGQYKNIAKYVDFITRWLGFSPEVIGEDVIRRLETAIEATSEAPRDWGVARQVCAMAAERGLPIASHDDDTPEKVALMAGFGVTISEFPTTLEAAHAARAAGMSVIMGAPNAYRGESTGGNLSASDGVAAGAVDILATDYVPASLLHGPYRLVERGVLALSAAIALVTANAADAALLSDRGRLVAGKRADLVLVEDSGPTPRVRGTFRAGQLVFADGMMSRRVGLAAPAAP
jgi:alpha-D-ribose 1-methylphosphonate 5-triphosphate diphosphatase